MHRSDDRLTLSASDVVGALACAHLTALDLGALADGVRAPRRHDPMLEVLTRRGTEHELAYLDELRSSGLRLVEIDDDIRSSDGLAAAQRRTIDAIESGADVIYQATFLDESGDVIWRGHADFLRRVDSADGRHVYEPEDTKLARHVNPGAVLQLCNYAEHVARVQGSTCEQIHVVLGSGEKVTFRLADFAAYYRVAKAALLAQVAHGAPPTYPLPVDHCAVCRWARACADRRLADDHLTLVAGLSKRQAARLEAAGITTMAALAASDPELTIPKFATSTLRQLQKQARLQIEARGRPGEPPPYELNPLGGADVGLEALPPPSPGDLFFDIESDPYAADGGLEYLLGIGWIDDDGEFAFRSFWAHSPQEEKQAFEELIDFIVERQRAHPDLHVYHYAPYESSALGRLMGRHGTREAEVDNLLRGRVLVDLYRVVRQAMTVGSYSYSIKKLEPLYMEARSAEILDAGSSVVEYERWLQEQDQKILDDLEVYNRDDCHSTQLLRGWLEGVRAEAAAEFGVELARPTPGAAPVDPEAEPDDAALLAADLLRGIDDPPSGDNPGASATWLLAQLLQWHRREQKPEWWAFFHRINDCTIEDLYDDSESIAGLTYEGLVDTVKRSTVHRYRFDPDQDYKIEPGDTVLDPVTEHLKLATGDRLPAPGTLVAIDDAAGTLDLRRGNNSAAPHPEALIPGGPINTNELRGSLLRLGRSVLEAGIDGPGIGRAARDLLLRRPPRIDGHPAGAPLVEGAPGIPELTDLAMRLDRSYLAVQGPPGTGKTYTAARAIVALIGAGKRVGITANSHAVITNLLDEVTTAAAQTGVSVRALQKCDEGKGSRRDDVTCTNDNGVIEEALADRDVDLVAGTAWLFSREGMADTLDHLVIDEAGQLSLANVVAVASSADNLVLVGDPQQLAQPSKGSHPPGAEVSGLEHILDGAPTVQADRGLFLEASWRMHPDVCAFVSEISYEDRLHSLPACGQLRIDGDDELAGAGLRWLPVPHADNKTSSPEEAAAIADAIGRLLGRRWTDRNGREADLTIDDVLVVAPYNAQVGTLRAALPVGARVGTVDKFQGQEGAVAIVSLAASSIDDAPRGLEFLLSRNRLNVAVSRAKAMAIVVGSPELLAARCRSVEQMRLANGLCRYVEMADAALASGPTG